MFISIKNKLNDSLLAKVLILFENKKGLNFLPKSIRV